MRVLIAEDSSTLRELLAAILASDPEIEVVAEAKDGVEAVELTQRLRPDIVTMDIHMPRMDGFEATKQIMIDVPTPIVIVSGTVNVHEVEISMKALRAGALTVHPKPPGPDDPGFGETAKTFIETVKAMSQVKVVRRVREPSLPPALGPTARRALFGQMVPRVVAIAGSTGGPAALYRVLGDLPGDFPAPILIVQHIAEGFVEGLATWLNGGTLLHVKVAEHGERLAPRTVYLAPDGRHLGLAKAGLIELSRAEAVGGFRPSATVLFESVAQVFGRASLAVMLTGMGKDGVDGLTALHHAGGTVLAQDEASSVVFGMPAAALTAGVVDASVPLDLIARRLIDAMQNRTERQ